MHAIQKNKIKIKYHKRRYTTVITLCFNLTVTTSYFFNCMLKISSKDEMVTSISSKLYIYGSTSSLAKWPIRFSDEKTCLVKMTDRQLLVW